MNSVIARIVSVLTAAVTFVMGIGSSYTFTVDTSEKGENLVNPVSNVNIWDMNTDSQFTDPEINGEYNVFEFVDYVQLMQCTGGNASRDLFKDPLDKTVLDDYDFSRLIENCRGIIELGAKPHLKLGSVPLKYSAAASEDEYFGTNVYPPDDYDVYYNYIAAVAQALVDEFGAEEVLTWRFGVMTEYENADWFKSVSADPQESAEAYFKLYDYTVQALIDVIGEDVFVGAHSMTVSEGLWDEALFIQHCANGTNYKTGGKSSRICFLATSFYDMRPGEYTQGRTLPECIAYLRETAEAAGLKNLIIGVDEGRIHSGNVSGKDGADLLSRTCGYTYQAAYDARLYKQLLDEGGDYLSSWYYLSGGLFKGNPTVSYHVASKIADFAGAARVAVKKVMSGLLFRTEADSLAAYDEATDTLRIMAYNFRNDVEYNRSINLKFKINAPQFDGKKVRITAYTVDDDCNYFDEWVEDRKIYGITDDCFAWSPEDPCIDSVNTLNDAAAREIYFSKLYDKYSECSRLEPVVTEGEVVDGKLTVKGKLAANGVVFYEITPCE